MLGHLSDISMYRETRLLWVPSQQNVNRGYYFNICFWSHTTNHRLFILCIFVPLLLFSIFLFGFSVFFNTIYRWPWGLLGRLQAACIFQGYSRISDAALMSHSRTQPFRLLRVGMRRFGEAAHITSSSKCNVSQNYDASTFFNFFKSKIKINSEGLTYHRPQ